MEELRKLKGTLMLTIPSLVSQCLSILMAQVDAQDAQKQLTGQSCTFDGRQGTLVLVMGSPFQLQPGDPAWSEGHRGSGVRRQQRERERDITKASR